MDCYIVKPIIEWCKKCGGSGVTASENQCPRCLGDRIDPGGHTFTLSDNQGNGHDDLLQALREAQAAPILLKKGR